MANLEDAKKLAGYAAVDEFVEDGMVVGIGSGNLRPEKVKRHEVPHQEVLNVINDCLQFDARKRPTFANIETRLTDALESCRKRVRRKSRKSIVRSRTE